MHPAFLYLPGRRLSMSELSAARIDGDVVELGEGYIPADLVEGPVLRAQAVKALIAAGTAASGPTAAWIHGARSSPPARHHVRRLATHRLRMEHDQRVVFHDSPLAASDVCLLGDVAVTTPLCTLCDLLLALGRAPDLLPWVRALADAAPEAVDAAEQAITARRRIPGRRRALSALAALRVRTT